MNMKTAALAALLLVAACTDPGDGGAPGTDAGPTVDAGAERYFGTYRAAWTCSDGEGTCGSPSWIQVYRTGIVIKYPASIVWGPHAIHVGAYDGSCFAMPETVENAGSNAEVHVAAYTVCPIEGDPGALKTTTIAHRLTSVYFCTCAGVLRR